MTHASHIRACVLIPLAALIVLSWPAPARAANSYCSPTGDFCMGAVKRHGVRVIELATFSFRGRVQVCVTHRTNVNCRRFLLRQLPEAPDLYEFTIRWSAHFPNHGPGFYSVRFYKDGDQLGRTVSFTVG